MLVYPNLSAMPFVVYANQLEIEKLIGLALNLLEPNSG